MSYLEDYKLGKVEWVEKEVEKYERETGIKLEPHNKSVLRDMKRKEFDFWERQAVRVDNNNSRDDQ